MAVAPVEDMKEIQLSQMSISSSTVTEGVLNLDWNAEKSPATPKTSIESVSSGSPASTKKRPAGASVPAAVLKKPAVAASAAGQEMVTELKGWLVSASFGEVKATRASQKSYIQARATASDKPYCLVNIEGKAGVDHKKIVGELVVFAQGAGLNKAPGHC